MKKILTLCIIRQNDKLLLGLKKQGFGVGRWNGFGGKLFAGETVEEAAKRETQEEAGIEVKNIIKMGVIDFEFAGDPEILEVHIFRADNFFGKPEESEEMKPQWFDIKNIPYDEMWPDDKFWLPLFLKDKKFKGKFVFGAGDMILKKELREVENL